jgi:hypothetical protein
MCEINESTNLTEVIGYKIANKKDDKYFSVFTGKEYKPGKVEKLYDDITMETKDIYQEFKNLLFDVYGNDVASFKTYYHGKSGLFKTLEDVKEALDNLQNICYSKNINFTIIEIVGISNDETPIFEGYLDWLNGDGNSFDLYIVPEFKSVKEVEL